MITCENARELGKKGNQVRWSQWKAEQEQANNPPVPQTLPVSEDRASAIERKVKQMAKLDDLIDNETDAKELHLLTASRERLFREWCALTRNPISGTFKAAPEKPQRSRAPLSEPT